MPNLNLKKPKQDAAVAIQEAAAKGDSAASLAHQDPEAAPGDDQAHALHGAKLLSAIAGAHLNHLSKMAEAKKKAPKGE